uniref:succinate dehydrogenase subunit 3 n=1 Tax=Gracilaria hainanensis TaxID=2871843 RepID=UPI002E7663CB|nr:succinate dehydrogenase subunit 3 [Gracilaria hainanensis]WQB61702.1 succinate dehydrogenase subunit 3 [Gracilaria hainanensis]
MYNRPISPHITIYAIQISSLSSIWHRVSGIFLTSLIVFYPIYMKLVIYSNYNKYFLNFEILGSLLAYFYGIFYILILFVFFYHALNGIKQIFWDLGFFLNQKFLSIFFMIISFFICTFVLLLIF